MMFFINMDILPSVRLIGHVVYQKPWMHFPRMINEYILYAIRSGELHIEEGGKRYELKKGDILLLQPNVLHKGFKDSVCDYFYVHFKHQGIEQIMEKSHEEIYEEILIRRRESLTSDFLSEALPNDSICYFQKHFHLENDNEFMFMLKDMVDEFYRKYENYKKLVSCRFLDFLIKASRECVTNKMENSMSHSRKAFIKSQNILKYLNKEYHKKISSVDIENIFESNYDYLNRVFHKTTGYSIFNYLNIVRINRAKEIIETTSLKFSEIGYLVGIDDQYYFSKLFKKYSGMTPTQYWEKINKV